MSFHLSRGISLLCLSSLVGSAEVMLQNLFSKKRLLLVGRKQLLGALFRSHFQGFLCPRQVRCLEVPSKIVIEKMVTTGFY